LNDEQQPGSGAQRSTVLDRSDEALSVMPAGAAGQGPDWVALPRSREGEADGFEAVGEVLAPPPPTEEAEGAATGGSDDVSTDVGRLGDDEAGGVTADAVPASDGRDRSERRKRRSRGVDEEAEDGDPLAGLGPMVRHLAAMTKELSEAQRTVGRLTAERDLLRQQLGDDGMLPTGSAEAVGARPNREARQAAKLLERTGDAKPAPTPEELAAMAEAAGRRRRFIALGVLVAIAGAIWIGRMLEVPVGEYLSKNGLAKIPYLNSVFQILLISFLLFRVVRVGGKAGSWLFPSPEEPKRRRR
jgi:hypothetical protein